MKRTLKHITEDEIRIAVANSSNWSECCRMLGLLAMTGSQTHFKNKCIQLNIDHSHFVRWKKSNNGGGLAVRPIDDYLSNKVPLSSDKLKKKLFKLKIKEQKCEICNLTEWYGKPAPLELDHKDSNHFNNNLDNLQIVCSNCHSILTSERRLNKLKDLTSCHALL
jgi:hypothetical protein